MNSIYDEVDREARHDWLAERYDVRKRNWLEDNGYGPNPSAAELHFNADCDGMWCKFCREEEYNYLMEL